MFSVGQKVVCVDARSEAPGWKGHPGYKEFPGPWGLKEGAIYTVSAIKPPDEFGNPCIRVAEYNWERLWVGRFRPLEEKPEETSTKAKTDISIFHRILEEASKEVKAPIEFEEQGTIKQGVARLKALIDKYGPF